MLGKKTSLSASLTFLFCGGVQSVNMYRSKGDLPAAETASDAKEKTALIATMERKALGYGGGGTYQS